MTTVAPELLRGVLSYTPSPTKYHHVVSLLTPMVAMEVRDILANPPEVDPFEKLCSSLKAGFGASSQQSLHQLVKDEGLGDRTPSQLLRHLRYIFSAVCAISEALFLRPLF